MDILQGSSPDWYYAAGHACDSNHAGAGGVVELRPEQPTPTPAVLPPLLLASGLARRASLAPVAASLLHSYVGVLVSIARPMLLPPELSALHSPASMPMGGACAQEERAGTGPGVGGWPLGLRVVHSRLVRAVCQLLEVPECLALMLDESYEPVRLLLQAQAAQDMPGPSVLTPEDLASKSAFLCRRLGAHAPALVPPAAILGGDGMCTAGGGVLTDMPEVMVPDALRAFVSSELREPTAGGVGTAVARGTEEGRFDGKDEQILGGADVAEEGGSSGRRHDRADGVGEAQEDQDEDERDDGRIDEMLSVLFQEGGDGVGGGAVDSPGKEVLLLEPLAVDNNSKPLTPAQTWYKKLGRTRVSHLIDEVRIAHPFAMDGLKRCTASCHAHVS